MRRIRLPRVRWLLAWAALAVLVVSGFINGSDGAGGPAGGAADVADGGAGDVADGAGERVAVVRVVDGDTIIVADGANEKRVRLIGVDTPESVHPSDPVQCFGPESTRFVTELLEGREVRVEHDPSQDRVDQYGRALAYVWLGDGTLVNELIIVEGYGHEYTYRAPYRHRDRLLDAQAEAERDEAGLWSPRTCAGDTDRPAGP